MPKNQHLSRATTKISGPEILGEPSLIAGEDESAYNDLTLRVTAAVRPRDIFEQFWVKDIVDVTWDILRYRKLKAEFLSSLRHKGVMAALEPSKGHTLAGNLAELWAARDPDALEQVSACLESAGLSMNTVSAHTLVIALEQVERIDRLIAVAEVRRNSVLAALDRHRQGLGLALQLSTQIEDAEYADVTGSAPAMKDAA